MRIEDEVILSFYRELASIGHNDHVFLVQHKETQKIYVKKVLSIYDADVYAALQTMNIPGVPEIHHIIKDDPHLIVIESYIGGHSLKDYLEERGPLSMPQAIGIMQKLCGILSMLHAADPPIIHRDIKPSNIILSPGFDVALIDFNASKRYNEAKTRDTILMGTADYAAPEQFGFRQSDTRTDIYALGVLLNVMLTGALPKESLYSGRGVRIIKKCINLDPQKRYATVQQLQNALHTLSQNGPSSHEPAVQKKPPFPFLPPGFRTMALWKIIIAFLGYSMIFWVSFTMEVEGATDPPTIWANRVCVLLWLLFTVALSCDYLGIAKKFPLTKNPNIPIRIFGSIVWSFVCMVVLILLLSAGLAIAAAFL